MVSAPSPWQRMPMGKADWLVAALCAVWTMAALVIATGPSGGLVQFLTHSATAAWAQAIGTFVAVVGAVWISRRDQQHRLESKRRDELDRARTIVLHARRLAFDVLGNLPRDRVDPGLEKRRWARVRVKWEIIEADLKRIDLVTPKQFRAQLSINGRFGQILTLRDQAAAGEFTDDDLGDLEEAVLAMDSECKKLLDERMDRANSSTEAKVLEFRTRDRFALLADMLEIAANRMHALTFEYHVQPERCRALLVLAHRRREVGHDLLKRPLTKTAEGRIVDALKVTTALHRLLRRLEKDGIVERQRPLLDKVSADARAAAQMLRKGRYFTVNGAGVPHH